MRKSISVEGFIDRIATKVVRKFGSFVNRTGYFATSAKRIGGMNDKAGCDVEESSWWCKDGNADSGRQRIRENTK